MKRVTIIEDDALQAELLQIRLSKFDLEAKIVTDYDWACEEIENGIDSDVILLDYDLGSDHGDGIELCRRIEMASDTPIVVMTGNHSTGVVVDFLNAGATQFVFKPCPIDDLMERIHEALRTKGKPFARGPKLERENRPTLDFNQKTANFEGQEIPMTEKELELLELLLADEGQTVYRDDINFLLYDGAGEARYADVLMTKLRRKLALLPGGFRIRSTRGHGYSLLRRDAP